MTGTRLAKLDETGKVINIIVADDPDDFLDYVAVGDGVVIGDADTAAGPDRIKRQTVRAGRDALLAASDWTQLADTALDDSTREDWASYRQALRDVPGQDGFPDTIQWPERPSSSNLDT